MNEINFRAFIRKGVNSLCDNCSSASEEQENEESEENFEELFPPVEEWLLQAPAKPYKEVNGSEY